MGAFETIKDIVSMVQKLDNVELLQRILNLQAEVQQLSEQLVQAKGVSQEKDSQISDLRERLKLKAKLVRRNELYFEANDKGKAMGFPYCSRCWEVDQKLVHINQHPIKRQMSTCPQCKAGYDWYGSIEGRGIHT